MKIDVLCVGKLSERYLEDAVTEYTKRLKRFVKLTIIEVPEAKLPKNPSPTDVKRALEEEAEGLLKRIRYPRTIVLASEGKGMTSEAFAEHIQKMNAYGQSEVTFVIGSSNGLLGRMKKDANTVLSFSKMTFPHQLMRVILLEQLYRAYKINNNEPYHK